VKIARKLTHPPVGGKGVDMILLRKSSGAYCMHVTLDESVEGAKKPIAHRSSETMMRTPGGWYTFLGGSWCWVYRTRSPHRKNRWVYYAVVPGRRGPTPRVKSLRTLETLIAAIPAAEEEEVFQQPGACLDPELTKLTEVRDDD